MPVRMEEVTVTRDDVTSSMRGDNLKRIDKFLQSASEEEAKKIRGWSEHRLMALGAIQPEQKPRKRDRALARVAVEAVPILLTLFVYIPLVVYGVWSVIWSEYFQAITYGCPSTCSGQALALWSVVSAVGFMLIILAYYVTRKLMIRARK